MVAIYAYMLSITFHLLSIQLHMEGLKNAPPPFKEICLQFYNKRNIKKTNSDRQFKKEKISNMFFMNSFFQDFFL